MESTGTMLEFSYPITTEHVPSMTWVFLYKLEEMAAGKIKPRDLDGVLLGVQLQIKIIKPI